MQIGFSLDFLVYYTPTQSEIKKEEECQKNSSPRNDGAVCMLTSSLMLPLDRSVLKQPVLPG
jgi:hypothetical protein